MKKKIKYNVLDLFCGCGGLSYGFEMAGFNVVLGIDYDEIALKSFVANHKNADAIKLDLFDLSNIEIIADFFKRKGLSIDVLIGGPPCQGFSLAGPRDKDDKRNTLYTAMLEVAKLFKPKAVILENVPGLIQLHGGQAGKKIISDFTELGYKVTAKILYAPDYGIPQTRKRVVFVGLKNGKEFKYPDHIVDHSHYVTCEDAISDLPAQEGIRGENVQNYMIPPQSEYQRVMRINSDKLYNNIASIPSAKTVKFLSMIPEGKNYKALPPDYKGIYKYHEALTRYHSKKPSPTINTCHRSHFHYKWNRIPTVRESARLQSFPDVFIFYGNMTQQFKQVGNAVPPLLGFAIAKQIIKSLDNDK